jgi:hypothetical protein
LETRLEGKGAGVPTMIVLVNLKEGVSPEDYECWIRETYAPAVRRLESVGDWRDYRMNDLLGAGSAPPYQYIVTVEIKDLEQLGRDMAGEEMRGLFFELHGFAEMAQMMTERFV